MTCVTEVSERSLSVTIQILERVNSVNGDASNFFKLFPMIPVPPALSKFTFIGLHPSVNIYEIFRFE